MFGAKRRNAAPDVLTRICGEADLLPFRQSDPHMLYSQLHGAARFGWLQHAWRAGMFMTNAEWGAATRRGYPLAKLFFATGEGRRVDGVVHWPHEGHRLIIGAPGSGKFTAALAPLLLEDDGANAFVIDPKGGEAALWATLYRNHIGRGTADAVHLLDPCRLFPHVTSQQLNPLDVVRMDNPNFVADADRLAEALVPDENIKDPFWVRAGRKVVKALILHAATRPGRYRRSLLEVQQWVAEGVDDNLLEAMAENGVADGLVSRAAVDISGWKNAEGMWQGIKAQVDASLMFLDLPGVRRTLAATDFELSTLRNQRSSLFVVIPNSEKATLGRWLRLIYSSVMDQIAAMPGKRLHVVVDEFAALGRFERVLTDLATLRSSGCRFHLAIQDLNQLHELYGHGWQTIIGNCALRQFLGVNDNFTADYLSHQLGQTTVQDGFDMQQEYPDGPTARRPRWVGRALRTPAELLGMAREEMIVVTDRTRPFLLPKCHFFDTSPWAERSMDVRTLGPKKQ
jgi:type IV secretion system protein VirD4